MICLSKKSFICFRPFLLCFSLCLETSLRGHVKHDMRHGILTNNIRKLRLDFSMLAHDQSAELFDLDKVVQQDPFLWISLVLKYMEQFFIKLLHFPLLSKQQSKNIFRTKC